MIRAATLFVVAVLATASGATTPIKVVVAESVYAEVARRVGGESVAVTVVMDRPLADPHGYEPAPSAARMIWDADVVVYNGLGYDAWVDRLLATGGAPDRAALNVSSLRGKWIGGDPHLWFDPVTMPAVADALVPILAKLDPPGAAGYAARAAQYKHDLGTVARRIAALRAAHGGTAVTATEPVISYLASALGLDMRHQGFQRAVMNHTEPAARDIAAVEGDLRRGGVRVLFVNLQVSDPLTRQLVAMAKDAGIPVVGVTENAPPGVPYSEWMLRTLDAIAAGLATPGQ
jgi:zinc/manganese transport system substrate-binding protein